MANWKLRIDIKPILALANEKDTVEAHRMACIAIADKLQAEWPDKTDIEDEIEGLRDLGRDTDASYDDIIENAAYYLDGIYDQADAELIWLGDPL